MLKEISHLYLLCILPLILLIEPSVDWQSNPLSQSPKKNIGEESIIACKFGHLAIVNIAVVDEKGKEVTTLSKDDFLIYEDDVEQEIIFFMAYTDQEAKKARARYCLGYIPTNDMYDGRYQSIRVTMRKVDKRKLGVWYVPKGYYATQELLK